jgi:hypothetical protein
MLSQKMKTKTEDVGKKYKIHPIHLNHHIVVLFA